MYKFTEWVGNMGKELKAPLSLGMSPPQVPS